MEILKENVREIGFFNPRDKLLTISLPITYFKVQLYRVDGSRGEIVHFSCVGTFQERNVQLVRKIVKTSAFRVLDCYTQHVRLSCDAVEAVEGAAWDVGPDEQRD